MSIAPERTALLTYLRGKDSAYYGKVLELREAVQGWLAYIPQTFPHYTRHTVEHSDEIIVQVSKLLFKDDDHLRPVINLSAVEAYILAAAAYLHDAGMVTPDGEKVEILSSDAWNAWVSEGSGKKRWEEVQALRSGNEPPEEAVREFLADVQVRFLIAEFVRRTHHRRSADIIENHHEALGRFDFDDPILRRTVSNVCVAHGLRPHELQDQERYPDRCDIRGQLANVRLLAILLRLGDLLDMSHDRACPLLLSAAGKLPADSYAHWTQYQSIFHRLTAWDRIEIMAKCTNHEEHRVLRDWCQWIEDEVVAARTLMARAKRHNEWQPPYASMTGDSPSIIISPAEAATYQPFDWKFELDHEAVFERLVYDVYDEPFAFVRELIQNALDASRCQMYADLVKDGIKPPAYPTRVAEERRRGYPVRVGLRSVTVKDELSGETDARQVLTVEDCGLGMDIEVIQRYFLQVGRSYYTTDEFRRSFGFVPASRFGVGFLSVFAVSDRVLVETYKPSSPSHDGPIRLILAGPRNYLLVEKGDQASCGTRIEVWLPEPMEPGALTKVVSSWCRRVELPVIVDDLGTETTIESERPEQFTYETPDITEPGAKFIVRAFPLDKAGIEGELYVFARVGERGESWAARKYADYEYPKTHPQALVPPMPNDLRCLHGISVGHSYDFLGGRSFSVRLDYRGESPRVGLARTRWRSRRVPGTDMHEHGDTRRSLDPEVESLLEEVLTAHLATSPLARGDEAWAYKQKLVEEFRIPFWTSLPGTIRVWQDGKPLLVALKDIQSMPIVTSTFRPRMLPSLGGRKQVDEPAWDAGTASLIEKDLTELSDGHRASIFKERAPLNVRWLGSGHLAVDWKATAGYTPFATGRGPISIATLPDPGVIGIALHKATESVYVHCLLGEDHEFVRWLVRIKDACTSKAYGLRPAQFHRVVDLLDGPIRYKYEIELLVQYLDGWRNLPGLSAELYPPDVEITADSFWLPPPR